MRWKRPGTDRREDGSKQREVTRLWNVNDLGKFVGKKGRECDRRPLIQREAREIGRRNRCVPYNSVTFQVLRCYSICNLRLRGAFTQRKKMRLTFGWLWRIDNGRCTARFHQENIRQVIKPEATLGRIQPHPVNLGILRQKESGGGGQGPNPS